ncbi:MAG: hypothetical protein PHP57_13390 [Sideroxydans sp.]|nr:hypothetical protein [Sideroxydans sp.]
MKQILINWLTARDNQSYSLTKLIAIAGVSTMCYNFVHTGSVDFQGFGIALTGIIAAMAVKYHTEKE